MTSRPFDEYQAICKREKDAWWDEIDSRAREMAATGMSLHDFANVLAYETKWVTYQNVLLALFLHYRELNKAASDA